MASVCSRLIHIHSPAIYHHHRPRRASAYKASKLSSNVGPESSVLLERHRRRTAIHNGAADAGRGISSSTSQLEHRGYSRSHHSWRACGRGVYDSTLCSSSRPLLSSTATVCEANLDLRTTNTALFSYITIDWHSRTGVNVLGALDAHSTTPRASNAYCRSICDPGSQLNRPLGLSCPIMMGS
jgi:hypothetical protein